MDEQITNQLAAVAERLAAAAEALEKALADKVDRIVAAIDDCVTTTMKQADERAAALERENAELKAQAQRNGRKTLSPLVSGLLAKNGMDEARFDSAALDKALAALSLDQRIAVKAEMARAGMIE